MNRQRIILILAIVGILLTSYMTYTYYSSTDIYCPLVASLGNCNEVSKSIYAIIFGIPAALLGLIVYFLLIYFNYKKKEMHVFLLSLLGVLAAGYFNFIMFFILKKVCFWCEGSHVVISAIFLLSNLDWKKKIAVFIISFFIGFAIAGGLNYGNEYELAKCLSEKNATMYGAFWCPHCLEQKNMFGKSFELINYVECSTPDKQQTLYCSSRDIKGYPTWEFADGKRQSGYLGKDLLKQLSGC